MSYEVKNGQVVNPASPGASKISVFELSKLLHQAIPRGVTGADVMHALNMLMGEAIARSGATLEQRKQIAEAFHLGLVRSIEMNSLVADRVEVIKQKLKGESKQPTEEEFRQMIADEFKKVADEMHATQLKPTETNGSGTVHDVGVGESAGAKDGVQ